MALLFYTYDIQQSRVIFKEVLHTSPHNGVLRSMFCRQDMTVAVVAEANIFNRMRTAWFANAAETQAPFLSKQRIKARKSNPWPRVTPAAHEHGHGIESVNCKDAPVNHSKRMHPLLFDQDRTRSLYRGNNLSREPLLEGLARAVVARFENPFYCKSRALFLAKRDGAGNDLATVCMRHCTYGRCGKQDGLTNDLEWWRAGEGMHPEEHARDGTGRALTLPVAHDCIRHELKERVLRWGYVQNGRRCRCHRWRSGRKPSWREGREGRQGSGMWCHG
jgi:hypothetical protein